MAQPELPRDSSRPRNSGIAERPRRAPRSALALALALGFSPTVRGRLVRHLAAPLIVALIPIYWIVDAAHRAALTTLGRDQGIFQYIAWAVSRGDVDYRDLRDVNGPLVHLVHTVMIALGGTDEHRFHMLDLWATGLTFAFAGACVPGLLPTSRRRSPSFLERAAWAFAGWVVLSGQYHLYTYWNQAQRESFCDWFLFPSLGLQIAWRAEKARDRIAERAASRRIVAIAALSVITWFGKPSFVLFTAAQVIALLFDDLPISRRARISYFAVGGLLGSVIPLAYLARFGDISAFARITFIDVPRIYRFIWAKSAAEILGEDGPLLTVTAALACSAILTALVVARELPRRFLVLAAAPVAGLGSVLMQQKGFGYHFHPLTAATHLGWLAIVALMWERFRGAPRSRPLGRYAAFAAAGALGLFVASNMRGSPHTKNVWILAGGETPYNRGLPDYFSTFKTYDFFPWEIRQAAWFVAEKTTPNARVQTYGMDPYLLFLAQRRSATPYILAYDLNADAAVDGGWSSKPTELETVRIKASRDAHEQDMLARLRASPPEAFVFFDRAPLTSYPDAWEDFRYCCAESSAWVAERYLPAASFGEVHVWLRTDVALAAITPGGKP